MPLSSTTNPDDRSLRELRKKVLDRALNVVAIAAPLLAVLVILEALQRNGVRAQTWLAGAFTLSFPVLRAVANRAAFRLTAGLFLGLLLVTAFIVEVNGGLSMSGAGLMLLALILSGVLFGRRGIAVGLAVALGMFVIAGMIVVSGLSPSISLSTWDPMRAHTWVRAGVALALFGAAGALSIVYVIEHLEADTLLLRQALESEKEQRSARERAEAEREHERRQREGTQRALENAQRLDALGRLAGGVAHDFNNSLTVIRSAAEFALTESGLSEDVHGCLVEVVNATVSAARLTRQLLALSRRDVAEPSQLEVARYLRKLEPTLRRVLPSDIEIALDLRCDDAVWVDEVQLERAVLNLAINARDAMEKGGRLEIGCRCEPLESAQPDAERVPAVALWMSDTGAGMDASTRERIFEPFFTTKSVGTGTGLGLAMVRGFVLDAGGRIRVDSAPGKGTTMTLLLPVASDDHAPSGPVAALAETATTPLHDRAALVVEDHPDVRRSIQRTLTIEGLRVQAVEDGTRALELLDDPEFACDLLCIDAVIPGASSARVIERALARHCPPAILVCSGYVEEELVRRGVQMGDYALLRKPFAASELLRRAREQLAQAGR